MPTDNPPPPVGIACIRCGDTDGPFKQDQVGDNFCEGCIGFAPGGGQ